MSTPLSSLSVPQRLADPNDTFRMKMSQILCDLRVALPCVVQNFYPDKMTVDVQIAVMEKLNVNTGGVPVATDVPIGGPNGILVDVPVLIPGGGGFYLTFPIQPGDECLVIFADMCYNAWWQNGGTANSQEFKRRHDLSDGFALFMPRSQPEVIDSYNPDAMELRNADGSCKIQFADGDGSPDEISILATGDNIINLQTFSGNINISAGGPVNLSGIPQINVNSPIVFNDMATFQAGATFNGSTTIDGRTFLTHTHTGVQSGASDTGPVA